MRSKALQRRTQKNKIIIAVTCLLLIALLIFGLTRAMYVTPDMQGDVAYEPALFNTVLLGELDSGDPDDKDDTGDIGKLTKTTNGEKITSSLNLSTANELGAKLTSNLKPGDTAFTIPFTITNGTTIEKEGAEASVTDKDDGDSQPENGYTGKLSNVAGSDIAYSLRVVTTANLPLSYKLYDIATDTTYEMVKNGPVDDDYAGPSCYVYTVGKIIARAGETIDENDAIQGSTLFQSSKRILPYIDDNTISVQRYELLVDWPTEDNDIKYMKEIDNIEIRVEVESYVENTTADSSDTPATGLITLKASVTDNLYTVSLGAGTSVKGEKTVSYDNLGAVSTALTDISVTKGNGEDEVTTTAKDIYELTGAIKKGTKLSDTELSAARAYTYDFIVKNGELYLREWNDTEKKYVEKEGTFLGFDDLKVAVAVPDGTTDSNGEDFISDFTYYILYDNEFYGAENNYDEHLDTDDDTPVMSWKWFRRIIGNVISYDDGDDDADLDEQNAESYQALKFYKIDTATGELDEDSPLEMDFDAKLYTEHPLTLVVIDELGTGYIYHNQKTGITDAQTGETNLTDNLHANDFRIYIYK